MSKSDVHARSSVKKFGGTESDYIEIHEMIDSSKAFHSDNRHRTVFHHTAGIYYMQKMFGVDFDSVNRLRTKYNLPQEFITDFLLLLKTNRSQGVHLLNSDGRKVHIRDVAEQHVLEDFRGKFIPSLNDYLTCMNLMTWMNNAISSINTNMEIKNSSTPDKISVIID
jgi:hypothetical protein